MASFSGSVDFVHSTTASGSFQLIPADPLSPLKRKYSFLPMCLVFNADNTVNWMSHCVNFKLIIYELSKWQKDNSTWHSSLKRNMKLC